MHTQMKVKLYRFTLFLLLGVILSFAHSAFAQSTAILAGTVTDPSGALVPGAAVHCKNAETGIMRTAKTDAGGLFRFPDLPVGNYGLTVSHEGFETSQQNGIVLLTGHNVDIPVRLRVGGMTQTVDVAGIVQGVQPTSSVVQTTIENKSMQNLPLNGRNPLQLVYLTPGVIAGGSGISVNGSRGTDDGYQLDGVDFTNQQTHTAMNLPSPDALQEFTLKTSNFSASESGAGGDIQFTTKSGTNHFHGAVFEYLRNNALDAKNYFATAVSPFKQNQFGGAVGGPIFKNKTFFFGYYQGTRTSGSASPYVGVVPSALQRTGDFSQSGKIIIDPQTGLPFPEDVIPEGRITAVAAKLATFYPLPNQSNGTYVTSLPSNSSDNQVLVRVDHELTRGDHLTARYYYDDTSAVSPQGNPGFSGLSRTLSRNVFVSDTHTFSSNLLLIGSFGYSDVSTQAFGITPITPQEAGVTYPLAQLNAPRDINLTLATYAGISCPNPSTIAPKEYDYRTHVTWTHGAHLIQFGIDVDRNDEYGAQTQATGFITFDGSRTHTNSIAGSGDSFADFLLGLPSVFRQTAYSYQRLSETKVQPWFQDDWTVGRRLTLNLGLRYEPWLPAIDHAAPQIGFLPGVQSVVAPYAPVGMVFSGDAGLPHAIFSRDMNNIAPRIGFAYDVNGNAKTVVRGAYGVFFRPSPLNLQRFSGNTAAFRSLSVVINDPPSFSNPYSSTPGGSPFPWTVPTQKDLSTYQFSLPVTTSALIPGAKTSYVQEWNLVVERQVASRASISATYVGNAMSKGMDSTEGNPATYIPGASTQANVNSRRPNQGLAGVQILSAFQFSNYNALQLNANVHGSHGVTLIGNYTWSKCMDNDSSSTGGVSVINKWDLNANYARCNWDVTNLANISVVYDLPPVTVFHGIADKALNHWRLSSIVTVNGGGHTNILSGTANSLTGPTTNSGTLDLADRVPGVSIKRPSGVSRIKEYFNTAAFKTNALGTFGNSGRDTMPTPGLFNWDLGLMKTFPVTEGIQLELRGEAFNFLNHTDFSAPGTTLTSANFGKITSAGSPRVVQVALRLTF